MTTIGSDTQLLSTDRHVRVTAGPGAGKTYWLAGHIENIIQRSSKLHSHARIAVISYTNVAAENIRGRLAQSVTRTVVGTIHSFLYANVVKPYVYLMRNEQGQSLVDVAQLEGHDIHHVSYQVAEHWLREVGLRQRIFAKEQMQRLLELLSDIRWIQKDGSNDWQLCVVPPEWKRSLIRGAFADALTPEHLYQYKRAYWALGVLDHDDVLYFATELLRKHPTIIECLSARYPFLLVDEFQDTVPAQTAIVRLFAEAGTTIGVIGDAEQSIYGFAGARPAHFREFSLPDLDAYDIVDNRRSVHSIVELLNHVRSDGLIQRGRRGESGSAITIFVGKPSQAVERVKSVISDQNALMVVARNEKTVQATQRIGEQQVDFWEQVKNADARRKIMFHELFAGVVIARSRRYDIATTTALRSIRHTKGVLKDPLRCERALTVNERRAVAIALLEMLVGHADHLERMTLRAAYNSCESTLKGAFPDVSIKRVARGGFATLADSILCGDLLTSVNLTNNGEVRAIRTIHKAKSAEADAVLVCLHGRNDTETQEHLDHILNPSRPSNEEQRITYVALSRARDQLYLATPSLTDEQEYRFRELGVLVVRMS